MSRSFVMNFRKAYDEYAPGYVSDGVYLDESGESFVQQADADSCDINKIVDRFIRTGILEGAKSSQGEYGDFSDVSDYHDALIMVQKADEAFMALPAHVRARFGNDAGNLLDFVNDPSNLDEAHRLGLLRDDFVGSGQGAESDAKAQPESEQLPT